MKYMLLIYGAETVLNQEEREACFQESSELAHKINTTGNYLAASPLQSITTATSVRVREGKRLLTDGPFAETREQLGGYFLIDAKDMEEAVAIAGRIPVGEGGAVEVRPIMAVG